MEENTYTIPVDRPLSPEESVLLEWLLINGNKAAKDYEVQLENVHVCGVCSCGCPTINLAIGESRERTVGPSLVLAMASGVSPEGTVVVVILHARENQLSELEVISADDAVNFSLPRPLDLEVFESPQQGPTDRG